MPPTPSTRPSCQPQAKIRRWGGEKEETRGRTSLVGPSPPRPPTSSPPDGVAAAVAAAEKEEEGEEPSEEPSEEEEEEERRRERRSGPGFPLPPIFSRV